MKKEKWILKEIDAWRKDLLINEDTAAMLKERYSPQKDSNFSVVLFSIVGAILIGAGIILLGAKNWNAFPLAVKVILGFLPLVISQAFAVFVIKFKYESIAWRETIAILTTASVFTVIALVGQAFHLSNDFGTYVLTCGLLSLPMIYILDSASPLIVYYWTILNWAVLNLSVVNAPILLGLFALGALYVFLQRKKVTTRLVYMMWITVIAGFIAVWIVGIMLECSLLLVILSYFVLLLSMEELPEPLLVPLKTAGIIGALITALLLTYGGMWMDRNGQTSVGGGVMVGVTLIAALFFAIKAFRRSRDSFNFLLVVVLVFSCIMRYIWWVWYLDYYGIIFMILSNIILSLIGVGFIVYGTKNTSLLRTNIGMAVICMLILVRFFDSDLDFLLRGIVFLLLGIMFLLVNIKITNKRKRAGRKHAEQDTDI